MIVDSSALIAIILLEPEAEAFAAALVASPRNRISAANYLEAAIVADGRVQQGSRIEAYDELIAAARLEIEDVTAQRAIQARAAYRSFGKGYHKARLNFGDCFAYALTKETGEPLLYKGRDFAQTDVISAV